jgi:acid phosphatase type 7
MRRLSVGVVALLLVAIVPVRRVGEVQARVSTRDAYRRSQASVGGAENPLIGTPYLQLGDLRRGNRAQVDLVWHAVPDSSAWSVEYKEKAESTWHKAKAPKFRLVDIQGVPAHRIYDTTLSRLNPGEVFDYRLLRNGNPVFTDQATAKNSEEQTYRFAVFGDCGAGTPSQRKVAYQAYLAKPNFIVIPGDIV